MGNTNCIYWGIFFEDWLLPVGQLDRDIEHKHVTFEFRGYCPPELVGTEWTVEVLGYANDGANEGVSVLLPDELLPAYLNPAQPHVTLSVSNGSSPKDTGWLDFDGFWPGPQFITGTIGYFGFDELYHF